MTKGFVYILRNEAMHGLLKIGYSVKVPTERVDELFTTGVPEPFTLAYYCLVENAAKLEAAIHNNLSAYRHRGNREFFRIELEAVVRSITSLCKATGSQSNGKHKVTKQRKATRSGLAFCPPITLPPPTAGSPQIPCLCSNPHGPNKL